MATVVFYLYAFTVAVAALPYGLVHEVPIAILTIVMAALLIISLLVEGRPQRGKHVFTTALFLFVVLAGWIVFQAHSYPPPFTEGSIWEEARQLLGIKRGSISLAPADTLNALIYLALPVMTFLVALILANTDARAIMLLRVLALSGGFIALLGLMQFLLSPNMLLVSEKRAYTDSLTAVYVNRNTAATHLGLAVLLLTTFAALSNRLETKSARAERKSSGQLTIAVYASFALLAFLALMLTQSRGGVAATALAALIYFPLIVALQRKRWSSGVTQRGAVASWLSSRWLLPAGAALLVILVMAFSASRAILRAGVQGADDGRFCMWPDVGRLIGDNWLLGTGFGTFRTAFSPYRDPACGVFGIFDRAHNSYLEGFATLGIIFPVTLSIFIVVILLSFLRGYRTRKSLKLFAGLGFAGTLLVATHALTDFSIQIPGFAVTYAAFLAGIISLCHGRDRVSEASGSQPQAPERERISASPA